MSLKEEKRTSSSHQTTESHVCQHKGIQQCPRTGRLARWRSKHPWLIWLFPIAGLMSLIWFLIRVVPKPSRAYYPCQRVAAPLASGFVVWIAGMIGSTLVFRKTRRLMNRSRYVLASICAAVAVVIIWGAICATDIIPVRAAAFTPTEPSNSPIGTAKGMYPGRVVWIRDANATSWDGATGNWWDDKNTDQKVVDAMVSAAIRGLTGKSSDDQAWDTLFRYFNKTKGFGDAGYQKGEKIAIKINANQDRGRSWRPDDGNPSPHVIHSLLNQLIKVGGVPGSAITVYDASRYVGDPIYDKVRGNPDPNFQAVTFVVSPNNAKNGRVAATADMNSPLQTKAGTAYLPQCVTQARYLINLALLRPHVTFGVTLCAKNHFGSTYFPDSGWTPRPLHDYGSRNNAMGTYNCLVNLNGHKQLGGKTLLYMIDGLYSARHQNAPVIKFVSFDNDWFSSILVSQDMVAIDSVGLDFLRREQAVNTNVVDVVGNPDNYMHEAALADKHPSGTKYDPEGDGTTLESLGVHEHWNNPKDRQYSRNLGTGSGIELITGLSAGTK